MTSTKYTNPLDLAIERKKEIGKQTRDNMLRILSGVHQPLMAREIKYLYNEEFGRSFDNSYVRQVLLQLADAGLVETRYETFDEALRRNHGQAIRGSHSALYFFIPSNRHVQRTATAIDGAKPTGTNKSKKSNRVKKSTQARLATPKVQTGTLESMLRERAVELESELEAIYRLIKK